MAQSFADTVQTIENSFHHHHLKCVAIRSVDFVFREKFPYNVSMLNKSHFFCFHPIGKIVSG